MSYSIVSHFKLNAIFSKCCIKIKIMLNKVNFSKAVKKIILPFLFVIGISSLMSCEGVADVDILNMNNISDDLTANEWTIGYYLNDNVVETNDFDAFKLTFKQNGTLEANKPYNQVIGRWNEDKVSKIINVYFDNTNPIFAKLSDNWLISVKEDKSYQFINNDNTDILKIERP